jgi:hypothetical protein
VAEEEHMSMDEKSSMAEEEERCCSWREMAMWQWETHEGSPVESPREHEPG